MIRALEKTRIPLSEAQALAQEVVELFLSSCERIEIAGSIRRKKATIGDIEIVCIPRLEPQYDLFGDVCGHLNLQFQTAAEWRSVGVLLDRLDKNDQQSFGERYQRVTYKDFPLDIFCVLPPAQWGVILTIRTGPDTFSRRAVTSRLLGGRLAPGNNVKDGQLIVHGKATPVPEEEDFFVLNEIPWVEPEDRF